MFLFQVFFVCYKTNMKNRYSPLEIRNQILRNRIVVPPMASQTALDTGHVSVETLAHYRRLALACPSLLIVEYTFVHSSGKSEDHQLAIDSDDQIQGLSELANTIKKTGSLAGIQITHSGGKSNSRLTGGKMLAPSDVVVPVKGELLEAPHEMTLNEINEMKQWFLQAASRAKRAGFDLVEIHSAHGYGLNQWLSPITNKRLDNYGRDLDGRSRLLLEIIDLIRQNVSELLISVRMPGQDFLEGGLSSLDSIEVARLLEKKGVDILHISSGIGGWRRPSDRVGEGYLVNEARGIAAAVQIPVIGVGGIQSGCYIDSSLEKNDFSLAAIGRAILSDPLGWRQQQMPVQTC